MSGEKAEYYAYELEKKLELALAEGDRLRLANAELNNISRGDRMKPWPEIERADQVLALQQRVIDDYAEIARLQEVAAKGVAQAEALTRAREEIDRLRREQTVLTTLMVEAATKADQDLADSFNEIVRLRLEFEDLIDFAKEGWAYADEYFQNKWNYPTHIAEFEAAVYKPRPALIDQPVMTPEEVVKAIVERHREKEK